MSLVLILHEIFFFNRDWLCAVCGILSLAITSRGIDNQVSLLPLSLPILTLIKNSSVTTLQLSRSERLGKLVLHSCWLRLFKKKMPRLNLIFMLSSR